MLSTIDSALVAIEGTAGLELPDVTESFHRHYQGVKAPCRGQGPVRACLFAVREPNQVSIELAHFARCHET